MSRPLRVLHVGRIDSIHLVKHLELLQGLGWEQHLVSSLRGAAPHAELRGVVLHALEATSALRGAVRRAGGEVLRRLPNVTRALGVPPPAPALPPAPEPERRLAGLIRELSPDLVVSHELQAAGYLTLAARALLPAFPRWAVSCWGIDLHLYGRLPEHRARLAELLAAADDFLCDSERDVRLARELGFRGRLLPVTPVACGYDVEASQAHRAPGPPSARRLVLLKGYQHWAGRALVGLRALARAPELLAGRRLVVYSAHPDVALAARLLAADTGVEVELPGAMPREAMLRLHGQARVSVGLSISDGVPQTFLEALLLGALPIQSWTSTADEWIEDGATGLLVPPEEPAAVAAALRRALEDDALVDAAAVRNLETARRRLDRPAIRARLHAALREVEGEARA